MLRPKPWQISPRLFWPVLTAALLSGVAGQLLMAFFPADFTRHYFRNPLVLGAVHLTTLGMLATLFLGITVQAVSVLLHRPRAGALPSVAGVALFFVGALGMAAFLAGWRRPILADLAVVSLAAGWLLLALQARRLAAAAEVRSAAWPGLAWAYAYLAAMLVLGAAMAAGLLQSFLPQEPASTLAFHIHLGLGGFAGMAIAGMLPKLLRLFQGSTGYAAWPQKWVYALLHLGVVLSLGAWLGIGAAARLAAALCFFAASLTFCYQLILLIRRASKLNFDSSFRLQLAGVTCLLAASGMDAWLAAFGGSWQAQAGAVYLALVGGVGGVVMGTIQRVATVLAWFERYFPLSMTHVVPTAWELAEPRLARGIFWMHSVGSASGFIGLLEGNTAWLRLGGVSLAAALASTLLLALAARRRGEARPFPDGINPYL